MILEGVGTFIAKQIDNFFEKNKENIENSKNTVSNEKISTELIDLSENPKTSKPINSELNIKSYKPKKGSGAWAILKVLHENRDEPVMTKDRIIRLATPFSNTSFIRSNTSNSHYTAWNCMGSTLIKKDIVIKIGNPPKFSLSNYGKQLAADIFSNDVDNRQCMNNQDFISNHQDSVHFSTSDKNNDSNKNVLRN